MADTFHVGDVNIFNHDVESSFFSAFLRSMPLDTEYGTSGTPKRCVYVCNKIERIENKYQLIEREIKKSGVTSNFIVALDIDDRYRNREIEISRRNESIFTAVVRMTSSERVVSETDSIKDIIQSPETPISTIRAEFDIKRNNTAVATVSAASGGTGFSGRRNKAIQTETEETKAAQIRAEKIRAEKIREKIVEITKQYNVKIIVVGHRGSGKSSLINTFQSAMENNRVKTAVARTEDETFSQNYLDYYIEENGSKLITLLDTSGLPKEKHETSVNDNYDQAQNLLENIKRAIEGKLPYDTNMLEEPKTESETTEPITIVLFVYNAQAIIGETKQPNNDTIKSLQIEVAKKNVASMLVLTHADCINEKNPETVREEANKKLGFNKGDILLIKCLVDLQAAIDTGIPLEDRLQALEVLHKVTHDGAEKIKMEESRNKNRQKMMN